MQLYELRDVLLKDSHKDVRRVARDFARKEIMPKIDQYEKEARFPMDIVKEMAKLNFLGVFVPEKYGGAGLDYLSYGVVCEEIAYADWVCSSVINIHNSLVGSALFNFANEEQKRKYLVPLATGEKIYSACLTEPNCGSDLAALQTTAKRNGDFYILNGRKIFISQGTVADVYFVLATIDRSLKHQGICAFVVDADTPGITARKIPLIALNRGATAEITFEDVKVPKENLIGSEGQGFKIIGASLDTGRYSVAERAIGQAQACVDLALEYANQRIAFGQQIGRFQMIQKMLADMIVLVEASRLLAQRVGYLLDQGIKRLSFEASMAKLMATDVCMKVATDAVQIFGGYGLAEEYTISRIFREAKILQIGEGTNELQRVLIAEYALGYRKMK